MESIGIATDDNWFVRSRRSPVVVRASDVGIADTRHHQRRQIHRFRIRWVDQHRGRASRSRSSTGLVMRTLSDSILLGHFAASAGS